MKKEELIALTKELLEVEDLSKRVGDLNFLKREYTRLTNREEETFYEKSLTDEFAKVYEELAKREVSLSASSLEIKKEIVTKAKALVEKEGIKNLSKDLNALFVELKNLPRCSKEQDDEIWAAMKETREAANKKLDEYFSAQKAKFSDAKAKKEAIIEEAKKALELESIKDAANKFNELLESWKAAGFAGKECDEELWKAFGEARKAFDEKRKAHAEEMNKLFAKRAEEKEAIIKQVKLITADAYFDDNEVKQIKDIQNKYRNIGFAGKDKDDDLYARFQAAVKQYFDEMKFYK